MFTNVLSLVKRYVNFALVEYVFDINFACFNVAVNAFTVIRLLYLRNHCYQYIL